MRGKREFWSLDFYLNDATLDPRPDSETLVEAAAGLCQNSIIGYPRYQRAGFRNRVGMFIAGTFVRVERGNRAGDRYRPAGGGTGTGKCRISLVWQTGQIYLSALGRRDITAFSSDFVQPALYL